MDRIVKITNMNTEREMVASTTIAPFSFSFLMSSPPKIVVFWGYSAWKGMLFSFAKDSA